MKGLNKAVLIVAKFLEITHWIGATLMAALLVCVIFAKDFVLNILEAAGITTESGIIDMTSYGFSFTTEGTDTGALVILAITLFIVISLMAMVFRNIYLIIKTAAGKTKFSEGKTPFQKSIVRMMREIGIFFIATTVVALIMSIIAVPVVSAPTQITLQLSNLIIGIFVLCLSQFFSYGKQLQDDVDGLL